MPELGKVLVIIGFVIVVLGLLLWTGIGTGWLGRLPGDIRVEKPTTRVYIPIASCLLISIVMSLVAYIVRRLT